MATFTAKVPWTCPDGKDWIVKLDIGSYHAATRYEPGGQDVEILSVRADEKGSKPDAAMLDRLLKDRKACDELADAAAEQAADVMEGT